MGVAVGVGVVVGVGVWVGVAVDVKVAVGVGVRVTVAVGVGVSVGVAQKETSDRRWESSSQADRAINDSNSVTKTIHCDIEGYYAMSRFKVKWRWGAVGRPVCATSE